MGVKVYVSGISGNKEVKKRQQRVFMILESKHIPYDVVDITEPGKEQEKDFMQSNSKSLGITVSDTNPRHPLPPQIFNDEDYCGDYDQFDMANEIDTLEQFLKVEVTNSIPNNNITENTPPKENDVVNNREESVERIETNGISSSREMSVESDRKSNGADNPVENEEVTEKAQEEMDAEDVDEFKKDTNASEDFIENERSVDD